MDLCQILAVRLRKFIGPYQEVRQWSYLDQRSRSSESRAVLKYSALWETARLNVLKVTQRQSQKSSNHSCNNITKRVVCNLINYCSSNLPIS